MKAWLLESRRLNRKGQRRRELAHERMEEEVERLKREVRRWEYQRAVELEEERSSRRRRQEGEEFSSSFSSSLSPPGGDKERRGAVLAGDIEHVDLRGVYRGLAGK